MNKIPIIKVGSTSVHKVNPVKEVIREFFPNDFYYVASKLVKTGVSEMPYGLKEIMKGATNRANAVWRPNIYSIGIEGGIVNTPNISPWWNRVLSHLPVIGSRYVVPTHYLCMAVVALKDTKGNMYYSTSAGMEFSAWVVKQAQKDNVTVGEVLSRAYGGDPTDPRSIVSLGRTHRSDSIKEAVRLVLYNVF